MAKEEKESQDYWNQRIGSCHAGFREGATAFGISLDRWQGWSGTSVLGRAPVKVCRSQLIRDGIWEFEMGVTVRWLRRIKTPKTDLLNELYSVTETGFVAWWRGENVRSFWNPSVLEFSWLSGLMSGQRHRMALASSTSWKWQVTDERHFFVMELVCSPCSLEKDRRHVVTWLCLRDWLICDWWALTTLTEQIPTTSAFGCIKPAGVGTAEEGGNIFAPSMFLKLYPKVVT